jgi:hypothetical protein
MALLNNSCGRFFARQEKIISAIGRDETNDMINSCCTICNMHFSGRQSAGKTYAESKTMYIRVNT